MSTSRLKKRLDNAADAPSTNLFESFVTYGTPLPSLESTKKDAGEFVPLWEQQVLDEQGRRRFHGAFTGGFSAGYFNSVGSKEGWKPSTFTSSRSERAAKDADSTTEELAKGLMDDEDLADFNSTRTLQTASTYAGPSATTQAYDPLSGPSTIPLTPVTAALASLIEPASARIGLKLMRKMGWREGQGVGPRVTLSQRKQQAVELGIKLDEEMTEEAGGEAEKHYYAPLDRPLTVLDTVGVVTDRGWGLGYTPEAHTALPRPSSGTVRHTGGDDDEDDEDVYGTGKASTATTSKHKWVQDLEEQDDGLEYRIKGSKGQKRDKPVYKKPEPKSKARADIFHDGTNILPGFKLHVEPFNVASTSQLPPAPPRNWSPNPQKLWAEPATVEGKGKGRQLDAEERGDLLGEVKPAPLPKSVFEYMSARSRERLAAMTSSNPSSTLHNSSTTESESVEPEDPLVIPSLDAPTALAALQGFQPFASGSASADPTRQARYTLYLQFSARLLPPSPVPSTLPFGPRSFAPGGKFQTIREFNKELEDYAKAARVFKPVSGMLAGRFTSGGNSGFVLEVPQVAAGLYQPPPKPVGFVSAPGDAVGGVARMEELAENVTPAQNAASAGMFGKMTRTVEIFKPNRLVCKRFGVQNPHPEASNTREEEEEGEGGMSSAKGRGGDQNGGPRKSNIAEPLGKADMEALMKAANFRRLDQDDPTSVTSTSNPAQAKPATTAIKTLENVGLGDDEEQGAETLTYRKAPVDIFAAIFAESDDEDEDEDEEEDELPVVQQKPVALAPAPHPTPAALTSTLAQAQPSPEPVEEVKLSAETLSSFKPSFAPSSSRSTKVTTDTSSTKKKSKRKATKAALSFDTEEGEEAESFSAVKKPKRSKPDRPAIEEKKLKATVEEEDEWTETKSVVHASILESGLAKPVESSGVGDRKRARASDLY